MKKICLLLTILVISTNISFAAPKADTIKSLDELTRIDDDLNLVINNIMSGEYNKEKEKKTLAYNRSRIGTIMSSNYVYYNSEDVDLLENRNSAAIIYTASLYGLSINGLSLYLEDPYQNQNYIIDAISEYKNANTSLVEAKRLITKQR